ncbi:FlgO family outer membrane protein [Desulfohalobium retbaense]|uniref:FlgO domain-containing protein n=1 Tax=Desulfohalobium retbaense (strain ATCC 49708 / DSM 5692 / JCM 16813 / HR100) TaxID=485915 RepID=C8X1M1_DESRD|nr:FlgO family outer membrane protein [Desulfohalobium retbaense]ACV68443.1 hypothetical protein Dret_1155 [Desulfohalobium retbaense DSM 5692]
MRFKQLILIALLVMTAAVAVSCAPNRPYNQQMSKQQADIVEVTSDAADRLLGSCNVFVDTQKPIIVTSLVDIDDMQKSSTLGRMSSEIIANRLASHGYSVREVKMGNNIFVNESEGELILSRELQRIGKKHDVQGFVVGTYAVCDKRKRYFEPQVAVSLRYVGLDNIIRCSHNYIVRNTDLEMWE